MRTAKVFHSGNSQAVRLPKEFRFKAQEVEIFRRGKDIILREKPKNLGLVFEILSSFSEDFMSEGRQQPALQKREAF